MKKLFVALALLLSLGTVGNAQSPIRHKIALFTPLYLDSAFDASGHYRYDKTFPKFLNPGLEFYQGAQMALDSLVKRGAPLEVFVYDSRSRRPSLNQQVSSPDMEEVELIIGQTNLPETRLLADAALRKKVPFISATLPNDAGINGNPYLVVLNSTLQTHVEGIYRFLQRYHSKDRIVLFRRNGAQEDQIRDYFDEIARTTTSAPLNIKWVNLGNSFSEGQLTAQLDSTRKTICIAGSLDETFGTTLAGALSSVKNTYPVSLIGMPTWDNFNFNKPEFSELEIVYSTPFYYDRTAPLASRISDEFSARINSRPTDMFFRGYEVTLRFALLLLDTKKDVASNLTRKGNIVFTSFDIQPAFKDKESMTLDYFENKKLYFIKVLGGAKNILY